MSLYILLFDYLLFDILIYYFTTTTIYRSDYFANHGTYCFETKSIETIYVLKRLHSNLPQQIIIGHLNINSIRNKFDIIKPMILDDTDVFMVTEIKLDDSFPVSQLILKVLLGHLD